MTCDAPATNPKEGWLVAEGDGRRRLVTCVDSIGPSPLLSWERPTLSGRRKTQWMTVAKWNQAAEKLGWTRLMTGADTLNHCPSTPSGEHDVEVGERDCPACGWSSPTPMTDNPDSRWRFSQGEDA